MALPSSESTYGSPPYHETAFKAALRLLASNIGPALQGLSAVRPGSNFGEAFLSSAGASSRAVSAAHQAAQAYAMKQQEMQQRQDEAAQKAAYMKALTDKAAKPEKPVETHAKPPWYLSPEWINTPQGRAAQAKATHIAAGKGTKPPGEAKPRAAVLKRIDAINGADVGDMKQRAILENIIANPPTPEEKQAAILKLANHATIRLAR